jgi:hypothetical protein
MLEPPASVSIEEHRSRLGDVGYWWPYVAEVLARHGLADAGVAPVAGYNPTYPTFLIGGVVVKLFGNAPSWRESHEAERAAYELLLTDPQILAPRLLGGGRLSDDPDASWPYLVVTRIPGIALEDAELSTDERRSFAGELGRWVRRVVGLETRLPVSVQPGPDLMIHADADQLEQRIGRVHRLGQTRGVNVVNLVAQGTIEEGMLSVLRFKKAMFAGVLDGGEREVFLGGTRLNKFLETVERVTDKIPPITTESTMDNCLKTSEFPRPIFQHRDGKSNKL